MGQCTSMPAAVKHSSDSQADSGPPPAGGAGPAPTWRETRRSDPHSSTTTSTPDDDAVVVTPSLASNAKDPPQLPPAQGREWPTLQHTLSDSRLGVRAAPAGLALQRGCDSAHCGLSSLVSGEAREPPQAAAQVASLCCRLFQARRRGGGGRKQLDDASPARRALPATARVLPQTPGDEATHALSTAARRAQTFHRC
jgi:hypothetical protein